MALPGAGFEPITVQVRVDAATPMTVTNQITVSGGGSVDVTSADETRIVPLSCDVNNSGAVDSFDLPAILNQALGLGHPNNDLNGDGIVNILDVQMIVIALATGACPV